MTHDISKKACAECGKVQEPNEIRVNERSFQPGARKKRQLPFYCSHKEYNYYQDSTNKIIERS